MAQQLITKGSPMAAFNTLSYLCFIRDRVFDLASLNNVVEPNTSKGKLNHAP